MSQTGVTNIECFNITRSKDNHCYSQERTGARGNVQEQADVRVGEGPGGPRKGKGQENPHSNLKNPRKELTKIAQNRCIGTVIAH